MKCPVIIGVVLQATVVHPAVGLLVLVRLTVAIMTAALPIAVPPHTEIVYNEAGEAQTVVVSDGGSSYVRPNYTPGSQTSAGKQNFREVVNAGAGTYKVIHCGSEKMTFTLKDADGKAKAADSIALKKLADGRWAINFAVKDATGCTIGAPLDRTYMYDTLGVSCVTINDTVIIDIAAESAAK